MGLVASMGMVDNMLLKSYRTSKGVCIDRKPARALAESLVQKLEIVTSACHQQADLFLGCGARIHHAGNPPVAEHENPVAQFEHAYPVRGLDINSSYVVYDLLNEQKKRGVAVVFVGEDLDVLLELSDRILVLCHALAAAVPCSYIRFACS